VAPARLEDDGLAVAGHGVLRLEDGGDGLEGDGEAEGLAVGDAALDAATVVGGRGDLTGVRVDGEGVVVLGAAQAGAGEAVADLEAAAGGQAHHGLGERGGELVEDRGAPAGRDLAGDAADDAADGVALAAGVVDRGDHRGRGGWRGRGSARGWRRPCRG
jgi:hypothetical protein